MPGKKGNCGMPGMPIAPGLGMKGRPFGKCGMADDDDEEEEGPLWSFSEGPFIVGFLMGLLQQIETDFYPNFDLLRPTSVPSIYNKCPISVP